MSRHDEYVQQLSGIEHATERVAFLRRHSGLPGPRGNLELVQAAADVGDERAFGAWIAAGSGDDPTDEFLVVCGVVGLGRLVAEGRTELVEELHAHASDPRWRVRESVAMALQRVGDADVDLLFEIVGGWLDDRLYVQRAAVAAVAEPRLLKTGQAAAQAVVIVDRVTGNLEAAADRHTDEFRVLRQALAYCWSVVVVADPREGKPRLEQWATSFDPDVRWVVRENLKKTRLIRLDREWVEMLAASLAG